jgi:PTH1 family peptidyl-tRNA hydrolase
VHRGRTGAILLRLEWKLMKLVVGLGNPGRQYLGTRHNIGYEVVDALAIKLGWVQSVDEFNRLAKTKFESLALEGMAPNGEKALLLMPMTFMNDSGRSVAAAMGFYQLSAQDLMVVLDDLALPCGRLRLRAGGSSGGHNGLKDIERMIGTDQYPRLRLGIDPALPPMTGKDYVLGKFTPPQRALIDPAIDRACGAIVSWIESGIEAAMNRFNADDKKQN